MTPRSGVVRGRTASPVTPRTRTRTPSLQSPLALLVLLLLAAVPSSAQETFTLIELGTLGGPGSRAYAINDHGDVVGESAISSPGGWRAFLWRHGTMTDVGTLDPDDDYSAASDISNDGTIVGWSGRRSDGSARPFVWRNGVMTALPLLPGHTDGAAFAISDLGQVVGVSFRTPERSEAGWERRAVSWIGNAVVPLETNGAVDTIASAINDMGQIVGAASLPGSEVFQAVLWEPGGMQLLELPTLPACARLDCDVATQALAINAHGQIAGVAARRYESYAVSWVHGSAAILPFPDTAYRTFMEFPGGINDAGDIAGTVAFDIGGEPRAVLWSSGVPRVLPGPSFSVPAGINAARDVVGYVVTSSLFEPRAVMWRASDGHPLPEPPQVSIAVTGSGRIWPPNGRLVPITFTGTLAGQVETAAFEVVDEYGRVQPSGPITASGGRFTFTVHLEASRRGTDRDGRRYLVSAAATGGGHQARAVSEVLVPHSQ
jgi:probable HAF family extracellular repeat protein